MFDMFSRLISIITRVALISVVQVAIAIPKASPSSRPHRSFLFVLSHGHLLCIYDAPERLLVPMRNKGNKCIHRENGAFQLTTVDERNPCFSYPWYHKNRREASVL